jgi:hypothetical protein
MPVTNLHLRSNVKGKEPAPGNSAGQLPVGSIAINFNADEPFLCIQDSVGNVRRIAGVAVGTAAPATPSAGEFWLDTSATDRILKVYDGSNWAAAGKPIPDASTTLKGIVQLANAAAITAGTAGLVVDAAQLKAAAPADASDTVKGIVRLATTAEATAGTLTTVAITPAQLKVYSPADASEAVKGIVELATAAETTTGTDATRAVHPAGLKVELDKKAPLADPALTGVPTAPTAAVGTNTTQIATTAFVAAAMPAAATPADATTTAKGVVQLADATAITAGTAGRVVDAAQLKAHAPADASTAAKGIIQLATAAEVLAGTDALKAVTSKEAKDHYLAKNIALLSALP